MDIKEIRAAICRNHGGLTEATDEQILLLWNSLDKSTQEKYLKKEVSNAVRS